jgi:rhodanese-related sulfurtransferase
MFENVSIKEALRLAAEGKAMLIDLREREAYQEGHLPDACWAGEENMWDCIKKTPDVFKIFYCDFGNQSMKVARKLDEEGYPVASIVGGYHAYEKYLESKKATI